MSAVLEGPAIKWIALESLYPICQISDIDIWMSDSCRIIKCSCERKLIEAGAELYELRADNALLEYYTQTDSRLADSHAGMHTKSFVVDNDIVMIGLSIFGL